MTKKQLKEYIKQNIKEILSEDVAYNVKGNKGTMAQTFKTDDEAKKFDANAANVTLTKLEEENTLNEMAGYYKVKDKAGFKKALKTYKELKGDKFDKNALGRLLVALDKEGEINIKQFSQGKDPATYNNNNTRNALEKPGGEFTDYVEAGKSKTSEKEAPKKVAPKKEAPKKEAPKKEEPKKKEVPKKAAPKKEEPKKKEKAEDDDFSDEKEPSMSDLEKIEKTFSFDDDDDDF